jgi:hypothetical protein
LIAGGVLFVSGAFVMMGHWSMSRHQLYLYVRTMEDRSQLAQLQEDIGSLVGSTSLMVSLILSLLR